MYSEFQISFFYKWICSVSKQFKIHSVQFKQLQYHLLIQLPKILFCKLILLSYSILVLVHHLKLHTSHLPNVVKVLLHGLKLPYGSISNCAVPTARDEWEPVCIQITGWIVPEKPFSNNWATFLFLPARYFEFLEKKIDKTRKWIIWIFFQEHHIAGWLFTCVTPLFKLVSICWNYSKYVKY